MAIRQGPPREDIKDYEMIDTRKVLNYDGFWTDLTLYRNTKKDFYVIIVGDIDVYPPNEEDCDGYSEIYEDALRLFESDIFIM